MYNAVGLASDKVLRYALVAISGFFLAGYIVYPLYQLFANAFTDFSWQDFAMSAQSITASVNSLILSLGSVVFSGILGVYLAYLFHFRSIPGKKILSSVVLLPVAIPPVVGVMAFLYLLGDNGLLQRITGASSFHFKGWGALLILHAYSFYPLFFMFSGSSLRTLDSSVTDAAHSLGAGRFRVFFSVILPHLSTSLASAGLLTFMASMASFSAPFIFGGALRFMTTEIYYTKVNGDTAYSAFLSVLLVAISFLAFFLFRLTGKSALWTNRTKGTAKLYAEAALPRISYINAAIVYLFSFIVALPILTIILISFLPDNLLMRPGSVFDFSWKNYSHLLNDFSFFEPLLNSLTTSLLAVGFTVAIGLAVGHVITRYRNHLSFLGEVVSSIPYGVPGTVIAIGLILSFNQPNLFSLDTVLVGTFWILPLAYTIRNLPLVTQAVKSGLASVDNSLREAAYSLGAGQAKMWISVVLPLIFPFVAEAALLVFIHSFGEFVATILLYSYSSRTAPIEIYSNIRQYNTGLAATYGTIICLLEYGVISLSRKWIRKNVN